MRTLTWAEVIHRRLARSFLTRSGGAVSLVDVAAGVCGIQAQVPAAADLGLGIRAAGTTGAGVAKSLWHDRRLVKTWAMRGTLHLLPAGDLALYIASLRTHWTDLEPRMLQQLGLAAEEVCAGVEAIRQALDGRCLTRAALTEETMRLTGIPKLRDALLSGWGYIVGPAAARGYLCFGPNDGRNVTFVRPDQWLHGWEAVDEEQARTEIARRYLVAYGPSTHSDFARWAGMSPSTGRQVFEALAPELEAVEVEGRRCWLLASDSEGPHVEQAGRVRLIPQYDCYLMGSYPREAILPDAARFRIRQHGRGRYEGAAGLPLVLRDGVVAGIWERARRGRRLTIRVELFDDTGAEGRRQLEAEAAMIGRILQAEPELAFDRLGS